VAVDGPDPIYSAIETYKLRIDEVQKMLEEADATELRIHERTEELRARPLRRAQSRMGTPRHARRRHKPRKRVGQRLYPHHAGQPAAAREGGVTIIRKVSFDPLARDRGWVKLL
jgi:hypothetical protein